MSTQLLHWYFAARCAFFVALVHPSTSEHATAAIKPLLDETTAPTHDPPLLLLCYCPAFTTTVSFPLPKFAATLH